MSVFPRHMPLCDKTPLMFEIVLTSYWVYNVFYRSSSSYRVMSILIE